MSTRLRTRATLLVVGTALVPLALLGAIALVGAHRAVLDQVVTANRDLAIRDSNKIAALVERDRQLLERLAVTLAPSLRLTPEQAERILKAYRLDVRELRQLDYVGRDGREVATARLDGKPRDRRSDPAVQAALGGRPYRSPVTISEQDLTPQIVLAVPQRQAGEVVGAVVASLDLTEMWQVIDAIHLGERGEGYARVVGEDGTLLAIGKARLKQRVFTQQKDDSRALVEQVLAAPEGHPIVVPYRGPEGGEVLAVGVKIPQLGWGLILEEPMAEAMAPFRRFMGVIIALSISLLLVAAAVGGSGARSVVSPIERLRLRAGEISRGLLEARVDIQSPEELRALGQAMNQMCEDLLRLQEDVRRKERIATLGRIAAGLAHDLKHPVRALHMAAKEALAKPDNGAVQRALAEAVDRELRRMEAFLDDLKRVSRNEPMRLALEPIDLAVLSHDLADSERKSAPAGVEIEVQADGAVPVLGNRDLLARVLANLASNAYEAMDGEGRLTLRVRAVDGAAELAVIDTGQGIPLERLPGLWNDFATTKTRGLGLGLPVCKRIVGDHGGQIEVQSEPGRTEFRIRLPLHARAAA